MNSSTDSDSSSEDEVEKARLAEACVSNDYFKGPKKAQKSINGKKPLDLNSSSASDIKVQKSKFNGSQFNDDIPEKFDEIIGDLRKILGMFDFLNLCFCILSLSFG